MDLLAPKSFPPVLWHNELLHPPIQRKLKTTSTILRVYHRADKMNIKATQMLQNSFSWTSTCTSSESNKNAIVKGKSCTLSWPDVNEKKTAIKAFWFMLHRTKKECLPPREWDGQRKQRLAEGDHTTVTTEYFSLTYLAKTVTYIWNRACPREQGISPPQPSNRFALIPHFTTAQIASDSCWKSLVFLLGLTVPSARPAHKKELASLICKTSDLFRKISTNTYRTTTISQAMALVHWP